MVFKILALLVVCGAAADLSSIYYDTGLLSFAGYCGDAVSNFTCYWCKQLQGATFQTVGTFGNSDDVEFGFVGLLNRSNDVSIIVTVRGTDNIIGFIRLLLCYAVFIALVVFCFF